MANIVRWNPFREMAAMQTAMDRLFEDAWRGNWPQTGRWPSFDTPALDVHENDTAYTVTTPLPGVDPQKINVRLQNGVLTISGEFEETKKDENAKPVIQERYYGSFSRSITLPQSVDSDKVEATYDNGILTLNLPKSPEAQPKQISIKTNKMLENGKK
jgi:HSP20 family protein